MKNKGFLISLLAVFVVTIAICSGGTFLLSQIKQPVQTTAVALQKVTATIAAGGTIHSQNEASLHFQAGGKLTYLPVKEGDSVFAGQTIGQLDTYTLQRQLTTALNAYKSTRDSFDQTQANNQSGVLQTGQKSALNIYSQSSLAGDTQTNAINDAARRILDQNQASLDDSVINVELANYAIQLATLTSPINGIVTHEDVTVANQNITPVTEFDVADQNAFVFRANVLASDIDFVSIDSPATITLNGVQTPFPGTVVKIYPQKTSVNGQDVYQVDIQSDSIKPYAKFGQSGSVLIQNNTDTSVVMIPAWTVLGHQYVWVENNGNLILKKIITGKVHGNSIEVISGLTKNDNVITNPSIIAKQNYYFL